MANEENDPLGLKPYGEALKTAVEKTAKGAGEFLGRICLPAAEEFGLYFKDKIRYWRLKNINNILQKAEDKIEYKDGNLELKAHPRIVLNIMEDGSLNEDDDVQEMWAGLLAASCDLNPTEDNLIYLNILKQLTAAEVRILNFICEKATKNVTHGLIISEDLVLSIDELHTISGIEELYILDREIDHMNSLDLFWGMDSGIDIGSKDLEADVTPSPLALNLYVRAQGHKGSPQEYWGLDS